MWTSKILWTSSGSKDFSFLSSGGLTISEMDAAAPSKHSLSWALMLFLVDDSKCSFAVIMVLCDGELHQHYRSGLHPTHASSELEKQDLSFLMQHEKKAH